MNPELEAKTNLLKSDPALYQLYNDLVVGKLITAEEFWTNRFAEGKLTTGGNGSAKGQPLKAGEEQQEIGLPSAFLVRQAKQLFLDHVGCPTPITALLWHRKLLTTRNVSVHRPTSAGKTIQQCCIDRNIVVFKHLAMLR